jgi:hypothetical protein
MTISLQQPRYPSRNPRGKRRPDGPRPSYLADEVLQRAAAEGEALLLARARKQRDE